MLKRVNLPVQKLFAGQKNTTNYFVQPVTEKLCSAVLDRVAYYTSAFQMKLACKQSIKFCCNTILKIKAADSITSSQGKTT